MRKFCYCIFLLIGIALVGVCAGAVGVDSHASSGDLRDAKLWEREPVAMLLVEPASGGSVVLPRTASNAHSSQWWRNTSATGSLRCAIALGNTSPVACAMPATGMAHSASCATFIALRHIIR